MTNPLIWLHPEALRMTHPVFEIAPAGTRAIFVWDDACLQSANYSLKRLIFLYESLCRLQVEILQGDTCEIIQTIHPTLLYAPASHHPLWASLMKKFAVSVPVEIIADAPFSALSAHVAERRFFRYWNKAEKSVLKVNAGIPSQRHDTA